MNLFWFNNFYLGCYIKHSQEIIGFLNFFVYKWNVYFSIQKVSETSVAINIMAYHLLFHIDRLFIWMISLKTINKITHYINLEMPSVKQFLQELRLYKKWLKTSFSFRNVDFSKNQNCISARTKFQILVIVFFYLNL